jgi:hypothetical protein
VTRTIDKGVPIPPIFQPQKRLFTGLKESLSQMTVGDSMLIDECEQRQIPQYGKRLGRTFCTRKTSEGMRIWRTE